MAIEITTRKCKEESCDNRFTRDELGEKCYCNDCEKIIACSECRSDFVMRRVLWERRLDDNLICPDCFHRFCERGSEEEVFDNEEAETEYVFDLSGGDLEFERKRKRMEADQEVQEISDRWRRW